MQQQPKWTNGSPCVEPRPDGMKYPPKPAPRHHGYIPDGSGVEWSAYDTAQMEAYAREAWADGWAHGYLAVKKRSRHEVLAVVVALYLIVALIGKLASA